MIAKWNMNNKLCKRGIVFEPTRPRDARVQETAASLQGGGRQARNLVSAFLPLWNVVGGRSLVHFGTDLAKSQSE